MGRAFGQWRMFVLATTAIWAILDSFLWGLSVWIDFGVLMGGLAFYAVARFRERERLMGNDDAEA